VDTGSEKIMLRESSPSPRRSAAGLFKRTLMVKTLIAAALLTATTAGIAAAQDVEKEMRHMPQDRPRRDKFGRP
jgi:hypothetical protein